jgi:hypothetical protein
MVITRDMVKRAMSQLLTTEKCGHDSSHNHQQIGVELVGALPQTILLCWGSAKANFPQ